MLLKYLVTSESRRALLRLLWGEDLLAGSVSDLAKAAGVSFAAAYRELEAMRDAGLARSERVGSRVLYRALVHGEGAELLRRLVRESSGPPAPDSDVVRGWLAAVGAPLSAPTPARSMPSLEDVVVAGLQLAHQDAGVARVFPVLLWRNRGRLDIAKLRRLATRRNERHALGYFLELTRRLGRDRRLGLAAAGLRDRRRKSLRLFFSNVKGRAARADAAANTPPLAKKWGFLMNMDAEAFASEFARHVSLDARTHRPTS
jgi:DNA-binding transcriptional ArsR family regulator